MAEEWVRRIGRGRDVYAWALERATQMRELGHPGLCVAHRIVHGRDDAVVAHLPRMDGIDLHEVVDRRGGLDIAEVVTVGCQVLAALAAIHARGLVHGDVSAANVLVVDGSCVLVDTLALPSERGTPGFADPQRGSVADAWDDVYAAARLLRSGCKASDSQVVHAWTQPWVAPRGERVGAAQAGAALARLGQGRPINVPESRSGPLTRPARTIKLDADKPWRVRRALGTVAAVCLAALVTGGAGALALPSGAPQPVVGADEPVNHYSPVMPTPDHADRGADLAAVALTQLRLTAVERGDVEALVATTLEDSPARDHAQAVAAELARGVAWQGMQAKRIGAEVVWQEGPQAMVMVSYTVGPHQVVSPDGTIVVPAQQFTALLDLAWTDEGWRVVNARGG